MNKSKFLIFSFTLFLALPAVAGTASADPSITMIPGKTEAVIGEAVYFSGTVGGVNTDRIYMLLSGNGLDENGVVMVNLNYKASDGKYTEVRTNDDGKWTYKWNTGNIGGFTPGQYTIYAMSAPVILSELENSGEIYTSCSVVIKPSSVDKEPYITIAADPAGALQGNPIRFTGYSEGKVSRIIYLFVTGPGADANGSPLGDLSAKASEGRFTEVQLTSGSYIYSWDTSVVPPGEYTVYAVTGPADLSELGTSGEAYAKVTLKITGESSGSANSGSNTGSSSAETGYSSTATPTSLLSIACALVLGFSAFGILRR